MLDRTGAPLQRDAETSGRCRMHFQREAVGKPRVPGAVVPSFDGPDPTVSLQRRGHRSRVVRFDDQDDLAHHLAVAARRPGELDAANRRLRPQRFAEPLGGFERVDEWPTGPSFAGRRRELTPQPVQRLRTEAAPADQTAGLERAFESGAISHVHVAEFSDCGERHARNLGQRERARWEPGFQCLQVRRSPRLRELLDLRGERAADAGYFRETPCVPKVGQSRPERFDGLRAAGERAGSKRPFAEEVEGRRDPAQGGDDRLGVDSHAPRR